MPSCPGTREAPNRRPCIAVRYRCSRCGHVGCDQTRAGVCTHQGFVLTRCDKCGVIGQKETVRQPRP